METGIILWVIIIIGVIFLIRAIGAWMLRINEIISLLKEIKILLGGKEEENVKREDIQPEGSSFDINKFRK